MLLLSGKVWTAPSLFLTITLAEAKPIHLLLTRQNFRQQRFTAENITFINSAGRVGQALALYVDADKAVFKNCRFIGNRDTIFAAGENYRQYFFNCNIEGTTDFIFGPSTALFEQCTLHSKANSYITAANKSIERGSSALFWIMPAIHTA
jgi:pectin methylesterase-like acyl-CoA thioesterase